MSGDFTHQVIAVTGGSGDIGGAICRRLDSGGATMVILDTGAAPRVCITAFTLPECAAPALVASKRRSLR